MKKEIPILFSTPMVQAILEGRKTMTRRIVKPQPADEWMQNTKQFSSNGSMFDSRGKQLFWLSDHNSKKLDSEIKCPYGKPGDVLWVRESWRSIEQDFGEPRYEYRATEKINLTDKWKPSIHMPKSACRLWLKITDVRVEHLQDISEADAIAEGVEKKSPTALGYSTFKDYIKPDLLHYQASRSFASLWQSINGEESWNQNPWVWVVSFKVLSTTGKLELELSNPVKESV